MNPNLETEKGRHFQLYLIFQSPEILLYISAQLNDAACPNVHLKSNNVLVWKMDNRGIGAVISAFLAPTQLEN